MVSKHHSVLDTRSYRGVSHSSNNTNIDYYSADVKSTIYYCAFGSPIPGGSFNSKSTRCGFGRQEKDAEIKGKGNSYTSEYLEYDPRIGQR
jgi:hypothetical protein